MYLNLVRRESGAPPSRGCIKKSIRTSIADHHTMLFQILFIILIISQARILVSEKIISVVVLILCFL